MAAIKPDREHELWLRRQAVQVASILPEDPDEALRVLAYARELTEQFLKANGPHPESAEVHTARLFGARPPAG